MIIHYKYLLVWLFIISYCQLFSQFKAFKENSHSDSVWLINLTQLYDSTYLRQHNYDDTQFKDEKIFYSSDRYLRIATIRENNCASTCYFKYHSVIQFRDKKKRYEFSLDKWNIYTPVKNIYKLPCDNCYLFLFEDVYADESGPYDWLMKILEPSEEMPDPAKVNMYAFSFRIISDTVQQINFYSPGRFNDYVNWSPLELHSYKSSTQFPSPILSFDTLEFKLHFKVSDINANDEYNSYNSSVNYLGINNGTYVFRDSAFFEDDSESEYYYDPPLASLNDTLSINFDTIGTYFIKTIIYDDWQERGSADESIIVKFRNDCYLVNGNSYCGSTYEPEDTTYNNRKPNVRLLADSSLILITEVFTNGFSPGECGGCDYHNIGIDLISKKKTSALFNVEFNSGNGMNWVEDKDVKNFYVEDSADINVEFDSLYWMNDSTIVFKVRSGSYHRNFYLNLLIKPPGVDSKLTSGELVKDDE